MIDENLGYYRCDGINFFSKIEACLYSEKTKKPIQWMFNQEFYSKFPWNIEPEQNLDQLYDLRSRQIREKYDYVILSYSGGADSNNILESFIRQNLFIDEIVVNHVTASSQNITDLNPNNKQSTNFSAEYQLQTIPRLKYISKMCPNTKITVLDVSETILDSIRSVNDESWILTKRDNLSVGTAYRYNYFYFDKIKREFDKNKKVCMLLGTDKPKTFIRDDKFYISFNDATVNVIAITEHNHYPNVKIEFFYWHPDAVLLMCKQAHMIKKWLEINPSKMHSWKNADYGVVRVYHERWLRNVLYSTWNNDWYQANKAVNWWHNEFDYWFYHNSQYTKEKESWQRGIDYIINHAPSYIQTNRLGIPDRLKVFSHEYFVGKINKIIL